MSIPKKIHPENFNLGSKSPLAIVPEIDFPPSQKKDDQLSNEFILIALLRKKEKLGYEKLYYSYGSTLLGVIQKIVPDVAVAEDLLSETFVKIISAIEQYDATRGRFFTWMINITRNLCFDKLRSKEFKNYRKNTDIDNVAVVELNGYTTSFNPEHFDLANLTRRLNPNQKILIDLAYFKGYTQAEISKELNMPLGTVKTRLRMAINELRQVFNYLKN